MGIKGTEYKGPITHSISQKMIPLAFYRATFKDLSMITKKFRGTINQPQQYKREESDQLKRPILHLYAQKIRHKEMRKERKTTIKIRNQMQGSNFNIPYTAEQSVIKTRRVNSKSITQPSTHSAPARNDRMHHRKPHMKTIKKATTPPNHTDRNKNLEENTNNTLNKKIDALHRTTSTRSKMSLATMPQKGRNKRSPNGSGRTLTFPPNEILSTSTETDPLDSPIAMPSQGWTKTRHPLSRLYTCALAFALIAIKRTDACGDGGEPTGGDRTRCP